MRSLETFYWKLKEETLDPLCAELTVVEAMGGPVVRLTTEWMRLV
jgi:hypothetical protein